MPGLPLWEEGRMMEIWTGDTLFFFQGHEGAMALYEAFVQKLQEAVGEVGVKVSKTQIAFANRCQFAFVSFAQGRGPAGKLHGHHLRAGPSGGLSPHPCGGRTLLRPVDPPYSGVCAGRAG